MEAERHRMNIKTHRPLVLCVLDGWGWRNNKHSNAVALGNTPTFDKLWKDYPHSFLKTSGTDVGLPQYQMGNSEVGHLNLGAGRIVNQNTLRISSAIETGSLSSNLGLENFIKRLKTNGGTCHLMGLISSGGVHSHQEQVAAIANIIAKAGVPVAIHAFMDGRDTPPRSGCDHIRKFEESLSETDNIQIATITGRFYAMDRDKRWDRIKKAYDCLFHSIGKNAASSIEAIKNAYAEDIGDEFIPPTVISDHAEIKNGDGLFMANFRADRARQILTALLDPHFKEFNRGNQIKFCSALGMVEYSDELKHYMDSMFPPISLENIFGEVLAENGLCQLRIAETEKYAHVTFFFNGGVESPFLGESRILVPSPKVATYDKKPEMSAAEVTNNLLEAISDDKYDFILVNFANPDMVGHTGILDAAIKAIETVDSCLGRLLPAIEEKGGTMLITADHGNAEKMFDVETGLPFTSHTTNNVPAILVNAPPHITGITDGRLADIAPTFLELFDIKKPESMTGKSLLIKALEKNSVNPEKSFSSVE